MKKRATNAKKQSLRRPTAAMSYEIPYDLSICKGVENRRRLNPQTRFNSLIITYVALLAGDIPNDYAKMPTTICHTQISYAAGISVASVFNYFRSVDDLHNALFNWLDWALAQKGKETLAAAKRILPAVLIAWPELSERFGYKLILRQI